MRRIKRIMAILSIGLFSLVGFNLSFAASITNDVEVNINKTEPSKEVDKTEPIYTPKDPVPVKILPQTGEIIASFMYIMIGLSILLFITGLIVNKVNTVDVRWDY